MASSDDRESLLPPTNQKPQPWSNLELRSFLIRPSICCVWLTLKRQGLFSQIAVSICDSPCPHKVQLIETLLKDFQWEQFEHPLYSPDLASNDYHLFPPTDRRIRIFSYMRTNFSCHKYLHKIREDFFFVKGQRS